MLLETVKKIFKSSPRNQNQLGESYRKSVNNIILDRTRVVLLIGSPLFLSITLLDYVIYPKYANHFLFLRSIAFLSLLLIFSLTFVSAFKNKIIWLVDAATLSLGLTLGLIVYFSNGIENNYYEALQQMFLGMLIMNSFFLSHTLIVCLLIVAAYVLAVLANPVRIPDFEQILANRLVLMNVSIFLISIMTGLYRSQHHREFIQSEELRRSADQLNKTNRKLIETEKIKDEFFSNVSHELRTPLTLTLAPVESLLAGDSGALTEAQTKLITTVHHNAVRLLQLVNGLLDFSRLEAQQLKPNREPRNVIALTQSALDDFAPHFKKKNLVMEFICHTEQKWVALDQYLYDRILFNLVSNAVKFTPAGGKITIRLRVSPDKLRLTVSDTGIGIPESEIPQLFQKFHQVESTATRRFEGTGLGLALVKEFATLLDGSVTVESTVGKGSSFTVEFYAPATNETDESSEHARQSMLHPMPPVNEPVLEDSVDSPTPLRRDLPKVLIAEDNAEMAIYIKSLLQEHCQSKIVNDGEHALLIARKWMPDLILADVMMPKMDGVELCRQIKSHPGTISILYVLLTAQTHRDALLRGWEAGADEYLFKPFHPKELVARVKSLLTGVIARRSAESAVIEKTVATAHAQAELEQLQLFAFAATHDMQEPLKNILLQTDVLESQGSELNLSPEITQRLGRLRASAERMSKMIEQLRIFANVKASAVPFQRVHLNKTIQNVINDLEPRIQAADAKVHIESLPVLTGDEAQLHQLFLNLIGNAIKFGPEKNSPIIYVRAKKDENDFINISVVDNGIGFEEKYADLIFKPFQRLHSHKQYEGTGMGLSIAQKIALRHGGKIKVTTAPGKGTTFTVCLPSSPQDYLSGTSAA